MLIKKITRYFFAFCRNVLNMLYKTFGKKLTDEMWETWQSFIKFLFIGLSNTIILFVVYYAFLYVWGNGSYLAGQSVGYFLGVVNSYFLNSRFVFSSGKRGRAAFVKMCVCYGITYVIQTSAMYLQVDVLGVPEAVAPVVAIIITTPINFVLNKIFAFGIRD
ncbi:MAG: GtrA family protein [Clostridia bacterium]|nr:GtrA family protein [Clostridia bacterium]